MADLIETSTWEPGIQQLERTDLWDAGVAGAGIANQQAKQLANRTFYLKDKVDVLDNKVNFLLDAPGPVICPTGSNLNWDGSAYALNFPITAPHYITPNDGTTRQYEITLSCFVDFTYGATANIQMFLYTTTAGPTWVPVIIANLRQPFQSITYKKVVTLGPAIPVKAVFGNNSTGANATFEDCQLHIREI